MDRGRVANAKHTLSPIHTADATKLFCRVGVGVVYMNSQLAHDDCRVPTDSAM